MLYSTRPNIVTLTQAQYDALSTEDQNNGTIYMVSDAAALSQSIPCVTLTQDQYDALSNAEKTNGNVYFITDGEDEKLNVVAPVIYSETERIVGVWTDGKPLYEKTLIKTTTYTKNDWVEVGDLSIIDIDKIVNSNSSLIYTFQNEIYRVNDSYFYTQFNKTTGKLNGQQKLSSSLDIAGTAIVIIRYTKTADTPGSGTWTPQGVPAHHYSTDEQIVGTWIDGKTLYEKTFTSSTIIPYNSDVEMVLNGEVPANIDVKDISAYSEMLSLDSYKYRVTVSTWFSIYLNDSNKFMCNQTLTVIGMSSCNTIITIRYTKSSS